jgi:arylsulfatase A-like enzyme
LADYLALLGMLVLLASCGPDPEADRRNVVLILVDTLRADHLGAYGYSRDTSPRIDAFANESRLFTQARAQAPCTYPSVNSLLTSRPPRQLLRSQGFAIPRRVPTLAGILQVRGWRTAGVSASPIVRRSPSSFNPTGGYDRGFDTFHEDCLFAPASCINRAAESLLADLDEPFLLYLHYMDPHSPYRPPPDHEQRFTGAYDGPAFIADGDPGPITRMLYRGGEPIELQDADVQHLVDLYDEEIRYFDSQFGELLDLLDELTLSERTIVALVSDHGEEFFEHGDAMHCRNLYDTQIRTPVILRVPGELPERIDANAQNLDVVPTLLDYLGVDPAPARLAGRSLRRNPVPDGPVFGWWRHSHSVVDRNLKLVVNIDSEETLLFDLERDPAEKRDLSSERPEDVTRLRTLLDSWLTSTRPRGTQLVPPDRVEEQLRAIGYLE